MSTLPGKKMSKSTLITISTLALLGLFTPFTRKDYKRKTTASGTNNSYPRCPLLWYFCSVIYLRIYPFLSDDSTLSFLQCLTPYSEIWNQITILHRDLYAITAHIIRRNICFTLCVIYTTCSHQSDWWPIRMPYSSLLPIFILPISVHRANNHASDFVSSQTDTLYLPRPVPDASHHPDLVSPLNTTSTHLDIPNCNATHQTFWPQKYPSPQIQWWSIIPSFLLYIRFQISYIHTSGWHLRKWSRVNLIQFSSHEPVPGTTTSSQPNAIPRNHLEIPLIHTLLRVLLQYSCT